MDAVLGVAFIKHRLNAANIHTGFVHRQEKHIEMRTRPGLRFNLLLVLRDWITPNERVALGLHHRAAGRKKTRRAVGVADRPLGLFAMRQRARRCGA